MHGTDNLSFTYRLNKTEYRTQFGKEHAHVSAGGRIVAFLMHGVPKVGPFKAMKLTLPNAEQQDACLKSVNATVDKYRFYLAQIHAVPMPVPPPDAQDVAAAKDAAAKIAKDATRLNKEAAKAKDPQERAARQDEAAKVDETAQKAERAAERTDAGET